MLRIIAAAAALFAAGAAYSQTTVLSPASQQVQLLGPQLVAFSGSTGNFDSLVTGLTSGAPVTLTTVGTDGFIQIVTFVPGSPLTLTTTTSTGATQTTTFTPTTRRLSAFEANQALQLAATLLAQQGIL